MIFSKPSSIEIVDKIIEVLGKLNRYLEKYIEFWKNERGSLPMVPFHIVDIAKKTIINMDEQYELYPEEVLYDIESHVTGEPVWYIEMIAVLNKELWPDAFETLVISDVTGKALYILNNHGVTHEIKKK